MTDLPITQWICMKGCGAILNSRSAAMHTCRGRDDNDPIREGKPPKEIPRHPLQVIQWGPPFPEAENSKEEKLLDYIDSVEQSIRYYFKNENLEEKLEQSIEEKKK